MTEGRADVEILGQRLSVRGRGTPEYIHELAEYLNGRIESVRDQARVFDPLRLSLLAGSLDGARGRAAAPDRRAAPRASRPADGAARRGPGWPCRGLTAAESGRQRFPALCVM